MIKETTPLSKTGGFTLMEMLVVVLIMGILASVAVPMYKKSTDKSRFMKALTYADIIKAAEERFFLGHRRYALNLDALDITVDSYADGSTFWLYGNARTADCAVDLGEVDTDPTNNIVVWCYLTRPNGSLPHGDRVGVIMFMDRARTLGGTHVPARLQKACIAMGGSTEHAEQFCAQFGPEVLLPTGRKGWSLYSGIDEDDDPRRTDSPGSAGPGVATH